MGLLHILGSIISLLIYVYFLLILLEFTAFLVNAGKGLTWNGNVLGYGAHATFSMLFPYNIDYAYDPTLGLPSHWPLVLNLLNLGLWIIPHSVLARPDVKKMMGADPTDKTGMYRSYYVLFSSVTLHLLMHFWQPMYMSSAPLWDVSHSPVWNKVFICGYMAGFVWLVSATFAIDHFEFWGVKQATGIDLYGMVGWSVNGFTRRLHYSLIRHPVMTGWFLMFFIAPTMTWNHLLFSLCMSLFILFDVKLFEEPRLLDNYPTEYPQYMKTTGAYCPMPFICGGRKGDAAAEAPLMGGNAHSNVNYRGTATA